jgi:hypothetical protein
LSALARRLDRADLDGACPGRLDGLPKLRGGRLHQHLQRGQLRMDPVRGGDVELVGDVDLRGELPLLLGRPLSRNASLRSPSVPVPLASAVPPAACGWMDRSSESGLNCITMTACGRPGIRIHHHDPSPDRPRDIRKAHYNRSSSRARKGA